MNDIQKKATKEFKQKMADLFEEYGISLFYNDIDGIGMYGDSGAVIEIQGNHEITAETFRKYEIEE